MENKDAQKGFNGFVALLITLGVLAGSIYLFGYSGIYAMVFIGSIWMAFDARNRDLSKLTGLAAIRSPFMWFVVGLFLFIVTFPIYLTKVYKYKGNFLLSFPGVMLMLSLAAFIVNFGGNVMNVKSGTNPQSIKERLSGGKTYQGSAAAVLDGANAEGNNVKFMGAYYGLQSLQGTQFLMIMDVQAGVTWYMTFDDDKKPSLAGMKVGSNYNFNCTVQKIDTLNVCHLN